MPVYPLFCPNGLFIWWPKDDEFNATAYIIQFLHNDTTNPTVFSEHIVGTTKLINEFHSRHDIEGDLVKIAAKTIVSANSAVGDIENATITGLRVAGNVTGILIPNASRLVVRVLVPVLDDDGSELYQDMRYVEWKTVRLNLSSPTLSVNLLISLIYFPLKIEDVPDRSAKFQIDRIGARSVTFAATDSTMKCVKICHRSEEILCEERLIQEPFIEVKSLVAFTSYKFYLSECGDLKTIFNEFVIKTQHDGKYRVIHSVLFMHAQMIKQISFFSAVPGPITNHKIIQSDGVKLEWEAPVYPNGNLSHYLIEWTQLNKTHTENVMYHNGKNSFKFPHTMDDERFNITICAVSDFGAGIPIYINLRNLVSIPSDKSLGSVVKRHDPRLGIAIGVLLSIICVIVCMWIIIRHRQCVKTRQQSEMNGGIGHHQFQNRSLNAERTAAATLFPSPPNAITPNCVIDVHEMQTLIVSATPTTNDKLEIKNGKNGSWKCAENGKNAKYIAVIERDVDDIRQSDDEDDNEYECSRRGLISSTPKGQRKSVIIIAASNDLCESNSSTKNKINTAESATTNLNNDDFDVFAMVASTSKTNILADGSIQENLPQDHDLHSISNDDKNNWKEARAIAKPNQQNVNVKRRSQPNGMSSDTAAMFDNSQRKLLDSTTDSRSSSSSSSSSCSSQNSSNNNRFKINLKKNSIDDVHSVIRPIKYNDIDHNHFHHSVESIADHSSPITSNETITNGQINDSDEKCTETTEQPSTIDLNEDSYFQKRLQKWDYRRPIVGPNG